MKRRQYLAALGGLSAVGLAGCSALEVDSGSKVRESSSDRIEFVSHQLVTIGTTPFAGERGATPAGSRTRGPTSRVPSPAR